MVVDDELEITLDDNLQNQFVQDADFVATATSEEEETSEGEEEGESGKEDEEFEEETSNQNPNQTSSQQTSEEDEEVTPFQYMYGQLKEAGFLDEVEGEELTEERFNELLVTELPSRAIEALIESYAPTVQSIMRYAIHLGEDLTPEKLIDFVNVEKKTTSHPDSFDDTKAAREYMKKQYLSSGDYSEDDIEDILDVLEDKDKLIEKATQLAEKNKQKDIEAKEQAAKQAEELAKERTKKNREYVSQIQQVIDEEKWKPEKKKQIFEVLNNVGATNAKITQHPKAVVQLADFYTYFNEETGEFDFSKYIDERISTQESKKKRQRMGQKGGRPRISIPSSSSSKDSNKKSAMNELT